MRISKRQGPRRQRTGSTNSGWIAVVANTASMTSWDEKRLLSSPTYSPLHNHSLVSNSSPPPYLFLRSTNPHPNPQSNLACCCSYSTHPTRFLIHYIIVSVDLIHIHPPLSFDLITDLMYPQQRGDLYYLGHQP